MDNMRLGGIVRCLAPWNIHNMSRHACGSNKATACEIGQRRSVGCCALYFLAAEVFASGARTVNDPIGVDLHEIVIPANVGVDESLVSPGGA